MKKHSGWKKVASFALAMTLVSGGAPFSAGSGGFLSQNAITAEASASFNNNKITIQGEAAELPESMDNCTLLSVQADNGFLGVSGKNASLTIPSTKTLTLKNGTSGAKFLLKKDSSFTSEVIVKGTMTGKVNTGNTTLDENCYISVNLSDGGKFNVDGLNGNEHLRFINYDLGSDENGTISVTNNNGSTITNMDSSYSKTGDKLTFTATPKEDYQFVNWTKKNSIDGDEGGILGTDPVLEVNAEDNAKYQVYANFAPIEYTYEHHEAKDATYEADGNIEYWERSDGKLFKDENYTTTCTEAEVIIPKLTLYLQADPQGSSANIDLNLYIPLPDDATNLGEYNITFNGESKTASELASQSTTIDGRTYYKMRVAKPAKEMMDDIPVSIKKNGEEAPLYSDNTSVHYYAKKIIDGPYGPNLQKTCRAMLSYGAAAQTYFGYKDAESQLANADIEGKGKDYSSITIPANTFDEDAISTAIAEKPFSFYEITLSLKEDISMSMFFKVDKGKKVEDAVDEFNDMVNATGAGYTIQAVKNNDRFFVVRIRGILLSNLMKDIKFKVGGTEITANPGQFLYKGYTSSDTNLYNVVKALYNYYLAEKDMESDKVTTISISLDDGTAIEEPIELIEGNSEDLTKKRKATATTSDNSTADIVWSSSNPAVATVDQNGNVTQEGPGTATITAATGNKSASCQVDVVIQKVWSADLLNGNNEGGNNFGWVTEHGDITYDGVTLTTNGSTVFPSRSGNNFNYRLSSSNTFTAPEGYKFKRVEIIASRYDGLTISGIWNSATGNYNKYTLTPNSNSFSINSNVTDIQSITYYLLPDNTNS